LDYLEEAIPLALRLRRIGKGVNGFFCVPVRVHYQEAGKVALAKEFPIFAFSPAQYLHGVNVALGRFWE
jgi:hypothetical protein